jgi:tRNA threonylcarbamoyladenosine modification (KEOPS) complex  Pcc1 subunit
MSRPKRKRIDNQSLIDNSANIRFNLGTDFSKAISLALQPESIDVRESVKVKIVNKGKIIYLDVTTKELSNLRAVINSNYLLIKAAYETLNSLSNYRKRLSSNNNYHIKSELS